VLCEQFHSLFMVFDVKIYFDLYEVCSSSNMEVCGFCGLIWGAGVLATMGRFCICLYPHLHSRPIILPPRFMTRHFLATHWTFRL